MGYVFGPFQLEPTGRRLLRDGEPVPLLPKAFDTLVALVENRGRIVEKDELLRRVWPDTIVEEANLAQNIFMLRKALGESRDEHPYIATVPRRGYQFVGETREIDDAIAPAKRTRSLAVLPFASLGRETGDEHLGLGMADALITRLGNTRQVLVRPTSAVRPYLGVVPDPVTAGRELGVDVVLEGSVQRAGDRIRVTVQLVSVALGAPVWGGRFDESFTDIFALQDSLSERLAGALVLSLTGEDKRRLARRPTEDREAYVSYLKGRHQWNRRTEESLRKAIGYFEEAIARDPGYAQAWSGMADTWTLLAAAAYATAPAEALARAREAALRALELDDELSEAHTSLALVKFRLDWDWPAAEKHFRRAIELNPGDASAQHFYGLYLAAMGRSEEALATLGLAHELDPLSLTISTAMGRVLHFARQYDRAIEHCRRALEMDPNFAGAHFDLGLAYAQTGRFDEAAAEMEETLRLSGGRAMALTALGYVRGAAGRQDEARRILGELEERARQGGLSPTHVAYVHAGLGDVDRSLQWLEKAHQERDGALVWLGVEPMADRLRPHPRFGELLRRMRLGGA